MNRDYRFAGIPLTPAIAKELIADLLRGRQAIRRQEIIDTVTAFHRKNGGVIGNASVSAVKKALHALIALETAQRASTGFYNILDPPQEMHAGAVPQSNGGSEDDLEISGAGTEDSNVAETVIFAPLKEVGTGSGCVYLYYLPAYKQLADRENQDIWPCKIGFSASASSVTRVLGQVGTALPERPLLALEIRSDHPREVEKALHAILTMKGRRIDAALGSEWFQTNPDEVLQLCRVFDTSLTAGPDLDPEGSDVV